MRDLPQLTTSARVAQLIRNVDNELQSMPPVPLQLNDKAVTQVYAWLSNNWKGTASK
jgi:mono/diheme cytochrome c family protein